MVVGPDPGRRIITDRILSMGHFAVAPVESVAGALAICRSLLPSVIVCDDGDVQRLREGLHPLIVPVVPNPLEDDPPGDLIDRIRRTLGG